MNELFLRKVKAELKFLFKQLINYKHIGLFYTRTNDLNSPDYLLVNINIPNYVITDDLSKMKNCDACLFFEIKKSNKNDLNIHYENGIYYLTFFSDSNKTYVTYGQKVALLIPQLLEEVLNAKPKETTNLEWLEMFAELGLPKEMRN